VSIELKLIKSLPKSKRGRVVDYDNTLKQFLAGADKFAEIVKKDVKPSSLLSALKTRINENKEFKTRILVHSRKIDNEVKVFLEKK
jgi:hypothetical protein